MNFKARNDKSNVNEVLFMPYLLLFTFVILVILKYCFGFNILKELLIIMPVTSVLVLSYQYSIILFLNFEIDKMYLSVRIGLIVINYIELYKIEEISNRRKEHWKYGYSDRYISIKGKSMVEMNISPEDEEGFINELLRRNPKIINKCILKK